jgi:hypothetical protein
MKGIDHVLKTPNRKAAEAAAADGEPPADGRGRGDVGNRLREMFKTIEEAPLPDEINRLVAELEQKRSRKPRRN